MSTYEIKRENGRIFCPLINDWHIETPEERVRQEYIKKLVEDYSFSFDQMAQEVKVSNSQRGQGKARADIVSGLMLYLQTRLSVQGSKKAKRLPKLIVLLMIS